MPESFPVKVYAQLAGGRRDLNVEGVAANEAIRLVQRAVHRVVFVRSELPLFGPYLEKLRQGKKVTTIRFRAGAVELPAFSKIPLFETEDFGIGDRSKPTAVVRIKSLRYQVWGTLNAEDAARDGFDSFDDMRKDLLTIYPKMQDSDWVTIYEIVLAEDGHSWARAIPEIVQRARRSSGNYLVCIGGCSQSGKTASASLIVERLRADSDDAEVLAMDDFCLPSDEFDVLSMESGYDNPAATDLGSSCKRSNALAGGRGCDRSAVGLHFRSRGRGEYDAGKNAVAASCANRGG